MGRFCLVLLSCLSKNLLLIVKCLSTFDLVLRCSFLFCQCLELPFSVFVPSLRSYKYFARVAGQCVNPVIQVSRAVGMLRSRCGSGRLHGLKGKFGLANITVYSYEGK